MSRYLYQLRTFQGGEKSKEEENKEKFKESIKEYIEHKQSEMKFDTFVNDYLLRRERKREKLKEMVDGKTAGMMYEDYKRQKENSTIVMFQDDKDKLENILDDDKLWTGQEYSDNEVSASEVFDQWINNNDRNYINQIGNTQHDEVIGGIEHDLYSFSTPSSSTDVTQGSIRNRNEENTLRRKPAKLFRDYNYIDRNVLEELKGEDAEISTSSLLNDETKKRFASIGGQNKRIDLFPDFHFPDIYRKNLLESNEALFPFSISSAAAEVKVKPTVSLDRNNDSDNYWSTKSIVIDSTKKDGDRNTKIESNTEIYPNFQVNFNTGIAKDWNFKDIWESKKSDSYEGNEHIVTSQDSDYVKLSELQNESFNEKQEKNLLSAIKSRGTNIQLSKTPSESNSNHKPLYKSDDKPNSENIHQNEISRQTWRQNFQQPSKEVGYTGKEQHAKPIKHKLVASTPDNPFRIFSKFPFSFQQNLEHRPALSNWYYGNNGKDNGQNDRYDSEGEMEKKKIQNLGRDEIKGTNKFKNVKGKLHNSELNYAGKSPWLSNWYSGNNKKDNGLNYRHDTKGEMERKKIQNFEKKEIKVTYNFNEIEGKLYDSEFKPAKESPKKWNNFGNAWKPILGETPTDQTHIEKILKESFNQANQDTRNTNRIKNRLNRKSETAGQSTRLHPTKQTTSPYNANVDYSEDSPTISKPIKPVKSKVLINRDRQKKTKFVRYLKRPRIRRKRPLKRRIHFNPRITIGGATINQVYAKHPQWRSLNYQQKSGRPVIIETRGGVNLGDWNSPVVDNLMKALLPLGSIALAVGSFLPSARGKRSSIDQMEEDLDRARVALGQHLHNFSQKFCY